MAPQSSESSVKKRRKESPDTDNNFTVSDYTSASFNQLLPSINGYISNAIKKAKFDSSSSSEINVKCPVLLSIVHFEEYFIKRSHGSMTTDDRTNKRKKHKFITIECVGICSLLIAFIFYCLFLVVFYFYFIFSVFVFVLDV